MGKVKAIYLIIGLVVIVAAIGIIVFANNQPKNVALVPATSAIPSPTSFEQVASSSADHQILGIQIKTSGCLASGGLPDSACTPGAIFPDATKDQVCVSGYSKSVRDVPTSEKNQVYEEYGLPAKDHQPGEFEVDHLVSLELGGSNDISNLWPELAEPQPGFHQKDKVENYLHSQVCSGAITLPEAQKEISTNWLNVYNKMLSP